MKYIWFTFSLILLSISLSARDITTNASTINGVKVTICVATDYGQVCMTVHTAKKVAALLKEQSANLVGKFDEVNNLLMVTGYTDEINSTEFKILPNQKVFKGLVTTGGIVIVESDSFTVTLTQAR